MLLEHRPLAFGLGLFVALTVPYMLFVSSVRDAPPVVVWLPYVAVFFGAAITGHQARARLFLQLAALSTAMAIWIGLLNWTFSTLGLPTDFPGVRGSLMLGALSLPFFIVIAFAGGAIGNKLHGQ